MWANPIDVAHAFLRASYGGFPAACRRFRLNLRFNRENGMNCTVKAVLPQANPNNLLSGFHSRGALPHVKREGGSYFVTFRLAGTLPKEILARLKAEREAILKHALAARRPLTWHEQEELFRWYASRVDRYLDAGHGACWLRQADIADLVANALNFHSKTRFVLHQWCVMPNHVHAVLHPLSGWTLSQILKSWKGYTGREANKLLKRTGNPFWQKESYDHLIRNDEDMHRCCHYTLMNPVNARLCKRPEDWRWSSAYRGGIE
jgi:REP element-mobilizing transposase RayT